MPRALRKTVVPKPYAPVTPDPVATGKRAATAIGTRDMLDAMRTDPLPGADVTLKCKARIVDWHSAVAQVSGTLVVAHGARGMSKEAARAVVKQLRDTADDIEGRLLK